MPARSAGRRLHAWMTTPSAGSVALRHSAVTGGLDAQPAARDLAVLHDLLEHVARERHGDRERDAQRAA
jgi:hypothetical protein